MTVTRHHHTYANMYRCIYEIPLGWCAWLVRLAAGGTIVCSYATYMSLICCFRSTITHACKPKTKHQLHC